MKKPSCKLNFHLFFILSIIFLIIVFLCIGGVFYFIRTGNAAQNGKINWSNWPISFTENFSDQIIFKDGMPTIKSTGLTELKRYNLWLQIIDKNGDEFTSYNRPSRALMHYSPMDILDLYKTGGGESDCTVFAKGIEKNGKKWTYIIGFPVKILKITMYLNYDKFHRGKTILMGLMIVITLLILVSGAVYGIWITKKMSNVIAAIRKIGLRSYDSTKNKGVFQDVYDNLNFLDSEIKASDDERKRNDTLREEWIANITHDIKTPLSPIKGYAELITDSTYVKAPEDLIKYGEIILNNAVYAEALVNDLKITYQLKNGMFPLNKKEDNIIRFLKEIIIDILNHPEYESRKIIFHCKDIIINFSFDSMLLQRAFNNMLCNAVTHNSKETEITVSVKIVHRILHINIRDNGKGMDEDELKNLFERYYRGTNTEGNTNGTGLGMAIAKQIIEAHGGNINVNSKQGIGTSILIEFPLQN